MTSLIHRAKLQQSTGSNSVETIEDAHIVVSDQGLVEWIGPRSEFIRSQWNEVEFDVRYDLKEQLVTPGLIDCHTHIIYGGSRANEWRRRLNGETYEQIANSGGGIRSTVAATRKASDQQLFESASDRAAQMLEFGVTTIEVKSGYGLAAAEELKMISVAERLKIECAQNIRITFLGAHAVPAELDGDADRYLEQEVLPLISKLPDSVDAIDVFCEGIAFDVEQSRRVLQSGIGAGLEPKIHSEQLSNLGGTKMAAELGAVSADHLEYLDEAGVIAMAENNCVAVLLPGAFYFINETQKPPIDLLRKHQVPIAIATDHNPGSSPLISLPLSLNFACTLFGMTPEEAFAGATIHAAKALRMEKEVGRLEPGTQADFVVWNVTDFCELIHLVGHNPCRDVYKNGKPVLSRAKP